VQIPNNMFFQKMFRVSGGSPSTFAVESKARLARQEQP
jgi:hypothetical protein